LRSSLESTVEITHLVGPCAHAVERAALHDLRPERDGDINVQESGDAAHLVVEVGFEVVAMDEQDLVGYVRRSIAALRPSCRVWWHSQRSKTNKPRLFDLALFLLLYLYETNMSAYKRQ